MCAGLPEVLPPITGMSVLRTNELRMRMTQDQLKALKAETDQILDHLCKSYDGIDELSEDPINWGDLSCVQAEWVQDDEGREYARVQIEEVDPNASRLQAYVTEKLAQANWPDIVVETNW